MCTLSVLWESKTALHPNHGKFLQTRLNFQFELAEWKSVEQDPVSTMQKTGWTNYSSFLVSSGKSFLPMALITCTHSITIFLSLEVDEVILAWFQTNKRPTNQVNQEQASLLLTSAVFCIIVRVQLFHICGSYSLSQVMVLSLGWECYTSHHVSCQVKCFAIICWWWNFLANDWLSKSYITKATK